MLYTKRIILLSLLVSFNLPSNNIFAETIVLKSGKTLEGRIAEQTNEFIKIDLQGTLITYFSDEIQSIDNKDLTVIQNQSSNINVDKNKIVEEILELSGAKKQLEYMPSHVESQLAQSKERMEPKTYELLEEIMRDSFKFESIYRIVSNYLLSEFNQDSFLKALDWYRSPLATKISELEIKASTPEALQEMRQFITDLESSPPSEDRIKLIQDLDLASNASGLSVDILIAISVQMTAALQLANPDTMKSEKINLDEGLITKMKLQTEPAIKQQTLISFHYAYRSLQDDELEQYLNFLKSKEGAWLVKHINQGLLDAIARIGRELGSKIGDEFSQIKNEGSGSGQ